MSLLEGRYRVEREIARGGMGRVFRAMDERLWRPVAIKTLHDGSSHGLQLRFVEEAQITGQLRHPNVIPVHELSCADNELFLAMKLIEGRELKQLVKDIAADVDARQAYPLSRRLRLFLQICEAMAFAHDRGVIHRDLKPQNVMLSTGDDVLVMDWGVAKPIRGQELEDSVDSILRDGLDDEDEESGQVTQRGAVIGTPAYMPPEQAEGVADLDARADVYALGSILYELLTFKPPYSGRATNVLRALFKGPPPRPRERAPELEIPAAIEAIALRAMAREREERYETAAQLADDVRAYLDDRAIGAYEEDLRETLGRLWRRNRTRLGAVAAALAVIALAWIGALLAARAAANDARSKQAQAESARLKADELADEVRSSMARQQASAKASLLVRQAYEQQAAFERRSGQIVLEEAVVEAYREARSGLGELGTQLAELEQGDALGADAPFRELFDDVETRVARRCVEVLLARAPSLLASLGERGEVELTAVDAGRIKLRRGERRAARELLAAAPASAERDALLAVAEDRAPTEVIATLERAMQAQPEAAWPYLYRAEALVLAGRLSEAEQDYSRAQVVDPLDAWIIYSRLRWVTPPYSNHVLIRNPQRLVAGESAKVDGERERHGGLSRELAPRMHAATALRRSFSRWRAVWEGTNKKGKPIGLALRWTREREDGQLPAEEAWQYLAEGALLYGEHEQARSFAAQGLEAFPDDRRCAGLLANALLELGELKQAREVAKRGLQTYPWDPRLNFVLGEALRQRGLYADAVEHLRVGTHGWLLSDRWERLARCLSQFEDPNAWDEGVLAAREALARDPFRENGPHPKWRPIGENPQPHRTLAALRIKQGRPILGALHLNRARILAGMPGEVDHGQPAADAKALAELHEDLELAPGALVFWELASKDPAFKAEAEARIAALKAARKRR